MKKSDIAMIVLIASVSVVVAFFVAKSIFGDFNSGKVTVKTIDLIESTIVEPDTKIFNENAINPAVQVEINGTGESNGSSQ